MLTICVMLATTMGVCQSSQDDSLSVALSLDYLKAASRTIESYDVTCRVDVAWKLMTFVDKSDDRLRVRRRQPGETLPVRTDCYRMIGDRGKYRYETLDPATGRVSEVCVIIGSELRHKQLAGTPSPTFTIRRDHRSNVINGADYREFLGIQFRDHGLHKLLSDRKSTRVSRERDGKIVLQADPEPERSVSAMFFGYRIALDPAHGMMACEWCEYFKGLPKRKSEVVEWREIAKGVFAPVRMRITDYQHAGKDLEGEVYSVTTVTVDQAVSSWNRPIVPEAFNIEADVGMPIVDNVKGVMTMGGKTKPGENIDTLVNMPVKFSTRPPPEPVKGAWPWWSSLGVFLLSVLVAIGLAWRFCRVARS